MFSGIVQKTARISRLDLAEKWGTIELDAGAWERPVERGESIAVQGICLTVVDAAPDGRLRFDVLRETFQRTNLGEKNAGEYLNLERSLRWGDPMGGHIVVGHVDGVGETARIEPVGRDWSFRFRCAPELLDHMVYKGSVSVDGVSLTIAELKPDGFIVHIIPYTFDHTTFGRLKPGDGVNLEADLLGKFVRRFVERGVAFPGVTWESLRASGLISETPAPPA